jgi:hypothetical protein
MPRRGRKSAPPKRLSPKALAAELQRLQAELRPKLPDIDPQDLLLILHSILRPVGTGRRIFLKRRGDHHVF